MKTLITGMMLLIIFTGCHPRDMAMMNMNGTKNDYKDCLKNFPNDNARCETQRKLYEIDRDAVEATSRGHIKVK